MSPVSVCVYIYDAVVMALPTQIAILCFQKLKMLACLPIFSSVRNLKQFIPFARVVAPNIVCELMLEGLCRHDSYHMKYFNWLIILMHK